MAIKLGTYTPKQGGFGIFIQRLSGDHLEYFKPILNLPDEITECSVTSERLKHVKSLRAANDWINKFKSLPIEVQIGKIGSKWIKVLPKEQDKIIVRVQYYKLLTKDGITITQSPFVHELESLGEAYGDYTISEGQCRHVPMTKDHYESVKDSIITRTSQANGIQGMCKPVSQIRKLKLVGKDGSIADRHAGFRTTTSANFFKGR